MLKEHAISIVRTLHDASHQAYLVGGCVRDLVLGREPADYDVTTDATPEEVIERAKANHAPGDVHEALRRLQKPHYLNMGALLLDVSQQARRHV